MLGSILNSSAIVIGGVLGLSLKRELATRTQFILKSLLGIAALYVGFRLVWVSVGGSLGRTLLQVAVAVAALVVGNALGRGAGLQKQSNRLGAFARERYSASRSSGTTRFGDGFVACSILYCVGPLGIVGAVQEGMQGQPSVLLIKALMDGMAAVAFARVFRWGSVLAALPVLAFQGTVTLLVRQTAFLPAHPWFIHGFGAVAGLLVAVTALVILDVQKVRLADYLPALLVGPLLRYFVA